MLDVEDHASSVDNGSTATLRPRRSTARRASQLRMRIGRASGSEREVWERIVPILDERYPPAATARPMADLRLMLDAIIYRIGRAIDTRIERARLDFPKRFEAT